MNRAWGTLRSAEFHLTHEPLADILGVHRPAVTRAASVLQRRGLTAYSRGRIRILNHAGLEAASCMCYAAKSQLHRTALGQEAKLDR
jgi:Mn-dependent DtxR family transcriptional regulator